MHKRMLLSFHPLALTAFCAGQMKSLEDNRDVFSALNTVAVGISVDSVPGKKAWAETLGIIQRFLASWGGGSAVRAFPGGKRVL